MQVRVARHTNQLAAIVRFYRDGLGLREIGHFEDHDGYDGVTLVDPDGFRVVLVPDSWAAG